MKFIFLMIATIVSTSFAYRYVFNPSTLLVFCDVGQGDAILVSYRSTQLLVDTGADEVKLLECLYQAVPFWDRTLEVVLISHADSDHSGAFAALVEHFAVDTVIKSPLIKQTDGFRDFYELVQGSDASPTTIFPGRLLGLQLCPYCTAQLVLSGEEEQHFLLSQNIVAETTTSGLALHTEQILQDNNDASIGLLLDIGNTSVLLLGDKEHDAELALMSDGLLSDVTILKASHHGAKNTFMSGFLEQVKPEETVISSGQGNRYDHPAVETLEKLAHINTLIRRTDTEGTIKYEFNEYGYQYLDP